MPRTASARTYGRHARKTNPTTTNSVHESKHDAASCDSEDELAVLAEQISSVRLDDRKIARQSPAPKAASKEEPECREPSTKLQTPAKKTPSKRPPAEELRPLTWPDVCPPGDRIEKIAEASYAEVYRVSNERGTSIIKVIRLESPIKPQTKAQEKSGLVDEEPHHGDELMGELRISEWLADIPGFVVYKERYLVRGKATKEVLETHQTFHRKMKRKDPDRLQFYPSPSRYLQETEFLVIELGDAGTSLENFELSLSCQLWDVFLLVAIALARAEDLIFFEHRDLHEGNLCVRQVRPPTDGSNSAAGVQFGRSGLDVTILDYGLSRADGPDEDVDAPDAKPVAFDLEKDLNLFTSTHAAQCKVYRQMRSFLIRSDRVQLPPEAHTVPYQICHLPGDEAEKISWDDYEPYSNVLWLAYIYDYLTKHFRGERKDLTRFKRETKELWTHLNPESPPEVPSFHSAEAVVKFAFESGWVTEQHLNGGADPDLSQHGGEHGNEADGEESFLSIVEAQIVERDETKLRRSPRRRRPPLGQP